ncbi:hypothetical protein Q5M85_02545 [Paraclostridium bifermentans]|nr:hypothetical protein [Paraclostridium bifermentans]
MWWNKKIKGNKKTSCFYNTYRNEIIENIDDIEKGKILDSNSRVFESLVIKYGGIPNRYSPQVDDYESLKNTIYSVSKNSDLVIS